MNAPEIVRASEDDVRAFAARRHDDDIGRRLYIAYAEEAGERAWIARDAGTPIGIAFARTFEFELYLCELFVEPSFRNAGLGSALLREVTRDTDELSRACVVAANDPATLGFLVGRGFGAHVPLVRIAGEIPREEHLVRMAASGERFAGVPIDAALGFEQLDALDREARGSAKPYDHAQFSAAARGTAFYLRSECVGYAYVWPDGRVGPLAATSPAYLAAFFGYALATLRRTYAASWCTALVPGSNMRVLRTAVANGLRVEHASLFASDLPQIDLARYVGFHALGF